MFTNKLRYEDLTNQEYMEVLSQYFKHLLKMPFGEKSDLLKYFGFSFFHDSQVLNISFNPDKQSVAMEIRSDNVLEDINNYRAKRGLDEISQSQFLKNPVLFRVYFSKVTSFSFDLQATNGSVIIDTAITSYDVPKGYKLVFDFEEGNSLALCCRKAAVTMDSDLISSYTNGKNRIPFCSYCRNKLITKRQLLNFINNHGASI